VLSAQVGAYRVASLGSAKRSISNVSLKGPALIEREAAMKPALEEEARRSATANPDQATAPVATPSTP
jgi:hypothetical protein